MWVAKAIEGRGHRDGPHYGRKYRVIVERADFGDYYFPGGQAGFTGVEGPFPTISSLPVQDEPAPISFAPIEIHPNAVGGMVILVDGLEVRRTAPTDA